MLSLTSKHNGPFDEMGFKRPYGSCIISLLSAIDSPVEQDLDVLEVNCTGLRARWFLPQKCPTRICTA